MSVMVVLLGQLQDRLIRKNRKTNRFTGDPSPCDKLIVFMVFSFLVRIYVHSENEIPEVVKFTKEVVSKLIINEIDNFKLVGQLKPVVTFSNTDQTLLFNG